MSSHQAIERPTGATRSAAFFDLDRTLIARPSALAFGRTFHAAGLVGRRAVVRMAADRLRFAVRGGTASEVERLRASLTAVCAGWDVARLDAVVAQAVEPVIGPIVYRGAAALVGAHRAAGRDVVVVSASSREIVAPIGALLGVQHVLATTMAVDAGRYTGEIHRYLYGAEKAAAMDELAAERGYDLRASYAYSDSSTDLPMLEAVGRPHAVNADRALRRAALERGWPRLRFVATGSD